MNSITDDVARYERWLRKQCAVVEADLEAKHERMRESSFDFLRATYFRWANTIGAVCPGQARAPKVLCVGDIHVENFGTWRDADARHVWGVNDFDEAAVMPYPYDLIRLVTSARLAPQRAADPEQIAEAVLKGYIEGLGAPKPTLIDQGAPLFQSLTARLNNSSHEFWAEVAAYPDATPPREVTEALRRSLPKAAVVQRFASRRKGGGGLGRPRFLVIAQWRGGSVVREAKALVPSAWNWAQAKPGGRLRFLDVAYGANRSPDPSLVIGAGYLIRRVAADARKLDVGKAAKQGLGLDLLEAMGADLGAIHAAHRRVSKVIDDLMQRESHWLHDAAEEAERAVEADYREFLILRKTGAR